MDAAEFVNPIHPSGRPLRASDLRRASSGISARSRSRQSAEGPSQDERVGVRRVPLSELQNDRGRSAPRPRQGEEEWPQQQQPARRQRAGRRRIAPDPDEWPQQQQPDPRRRAGRRETWSEPSEIPTRRRVGGGRGVPEQRAQQWQPAEAAAGARGQERVPAWPPRPPRPPFPATSPAAGAWEGTGKAAVVGQGPDGVPRVAVQTPSAGQVVEQPDGGDGWNSRPLGAFRQMIGPELPPGWDEESDFDSAPSPPPSSALKAG